MNAELLTKYAHQCRSIIKAHGCPADRDWKCIDCVVERDDEGILECNDNLAFSRAVNFVLKYAEFEEGKFVFHIGKNACEGACKSIW